MTSARLIGSLDKGKLVSSVCVCVCWAKVMSSAALRRWQHLTVGPSGAK